ncbi:hypothetical protein KM031_10720 [Gemmobacter fulvus]|uniref:Uncharacterized protein n=1 Tax=Gemmobacter fulvus TaxID=2840474 RepID=A0A975S083_9RHOB|nr:hypothetical protein [Gemmobacter fulvus]MBT9245831.1 hypothetical protein [Gemmobacter fulvus]MDQ1846954.1 hypothetical protein [Gemmobacter fulvus]QWK89332.1 hypothetical protein KM031_10720 [Gemmobacter fulvus]
MSRHLADKRAPSNGGRVKQFLRIAHQNAQDLWQDSRRRPVPVAVNNRRMVEFLRIARGRQV